MAHGGAIEEVREMASQKIIDAISAQLAEFGAEMTRAFAELKSENAKMKVSFAEVKAEIKA